ncbi:PhzF family phenazine biosynthesis protein [Bordetella genomosp. 13]|uniref:PhzF family phenazine biosynthesis protein n=1 Tax=Bordetella genomosp. 13 TaxID=463040 RepID=UPI0011A7326E|nr:PhzF family phenazine biosynthesis protein [Bordetella genomosp. 13]
MPSYAYHLVNVFAESTFGGNPLCVFEDARGMDDALMQSLALQFNLSETTFVLPSDQADARVRIYTPGYEMRFAGHPTLGTAHVVSQVRGAGEALTLEVKAGLVPVAAEGNLWTLTAPTDGAPRTERVSASRADVASLLGLSEDDLLDDPLRVDTGNDQLLIPLKSFDAVRRAMPNPARADWPQSSVGRRTAYVFSIGDTAADGRQAALARHFFVKPGGGVVEDPATGSACANLGGWLLTRGHPLPARLVVSQGEQAGRPSTLYLDVTEDRKIRVGGRVIALGKGEVTVGG